MTQDTDDLTPEPAEDDVGDHLPLIELETLLNRPPSRGKRLAQVGLGAIAAVILLVMFWGSLGTGRPAAVAPTPTPTPFPPSLSIQSNVNYGTLTINGKKQAWSQPVTMFTSRDMYIISLDAPPFRQVTCHLSLNDLQAAGSEQEHKNCVSYSSIPNPRVGTLAFELSIFFTAADLPTGQQSQVTDLLTQALTIQQETTVPAGFYYATKNSERYDPGQRASAPLHATATVAPLAPKDPANLSFCVDFMCPLAPTLAGSNYVLTGHQWGISVMLGLRWRFSTSSGTLVSDVLFQDLDLYDQVQTSASVYLFLNGAGDWAISQYAPVPDLPNQLASSFCAIGENILRGNAPPGEHGTILTLQDQGALGCKWLVQVNNVDQGTFLWRFGVLLAADAKTHAAYPQLAVAPPAELVDLGG
jgi:hypothetical protein